MRDFEGIAAKGRRTKRANRSTAVRRAGFAQAELTEVTGLSRKKTHEEFIAEVAQNGHPDLEVVGRYIDANTKVKCRCKACGHEWWALPSSIRRGHGCNICASRRAGEKMRMDDSEFRRIVSEKSGSAIEVLEPYAGGKSRVRCRCAICGHEWAPVAQSLMSGYGCPACAGTMRRDTAVYKAALSEKNPDIELLSEYKNSSGRVTVRCRVCGHEWTPIASSLLAGRGCPECGRIRSGLSRRVGNEEFLKRLAAVNDRVAPLEEYEFAAKKILCRCLTCGHEWRVTPADLLSGRGCPSCRNAETSRRTRKSHEQFVDELRTRNPSIEPLEEYVTSQDKIRCRCRRCGNVWNPAPSDLLSGYGCPRCAHSQTSFMEQFIYFAFCEAFGADLVLSRDRSLAGVELDIAVPSKMLAVEPGSWHWHKDRLENDRFKREACREHGIRLLLVYDGFDDEGEPPFENDCIVVREDLGAVANRRKLVDVTLTLLREAGFDGPFEESRWSIIEGQASTASRRMGNKEFIDEIAKISPDVEVLGEYSAYDRRVSCRCRVCGREWSPVAGSLLAGSGCPICRRQNGSKKRLKSGDQFQRELHDVNPNIVVIGEYKGCKAKVACRCAVCGAEWSSSQSNLLRNGKCPECAKKARAIAATKTTEQFVMELALKNPSVELIGTYVGARTKTDVKCRTCGHTWKASPDNLLHGYGCPKCHGCYRRTHEDFKEEMASTGCKAIELLGRYTNNKTRIPCKCRECGYEWDANPRVLLKQGRCPNCHAR